MAAGSHTFIDDVLDRVGLSNVLVTSRYPVLDAEEISTLKPNLVLLSSEPYPFKDKHFSEFQMLLPNSRIMIVDGEMFSWYGSRLVKSVVYLFELFSRIM